MEKPQAPSKVDGHKALGFTLNAALKTVERHAGPHVVRGAIRHLTQREVTVSIVTLADGDYDFELNW